MNPYFSVVVSVYNKEQFLKNTIISVLNQTYSDFEIIAINDGSTDHSLDILREFDDPRIKIINQKNHGASHARNQGLSIAKGEFIALLDGDDIWNNRFLEHIIKAIHKYPKEFVFASAIAHTYGNRIVPITYSISTSDTIGVYNYFEASQKHSILSGSSTVFKKSILKTIGTFNEKIKSGQDTDLWIRIGIHYRVVFINTILVHYVYNTNSLSNTTTNINDKPKFDQYLDDEKLNNYLKKFLDRNRFSLAVLSKINDDRTSYNFYKQALSEENLTLKQNIILKCPKWVIILLLKMKALKGKKTYYTTL